MAASIYHLVPRSQFRSGCSDGTYRPDSLEREGFVHCAEERCVLAVADDYFAGVTEDLLVLEIDSERLASATVYEAPAPLAGGGTAHLEMATRFPHVYGPIGLAAIVRVAVLLRHAGGYGWPDELLAPRAFLTLG